MRYKIRFITFIDLLFVLMLGISGSMKSEGLSTAVYYLAFVIPVLLGISYIFTASEASGKNRREVCHRMLCDLRINKKGALLALPLIIAGIGAVALLSLATTSVMAFFGKENSVSFTEPFMAALFIHALLPALLEELLFRFIPINLLRDAPKTAILISALFFSLAHTNVFQIPYAFAAGLIFAFLYFITESILPCVLMHFLNNTISLISIYGYDSTAFWITFAALCALSLIITAAYRKPYINALKRMKADSKLEVGYSPILFAVISLTFAISALFA